MSQEQGTNEVVGGQAPKVSSFRDRLAQRVGDRAQEEAQVLASNVVNIATGTHGGNAGKSNGKAKGNGKAATKTSGPPMSLRCARWFFGHGMDGRKLSIEMRGENVIVRAWNGTYWQKLSATVAQARIQRWLEQFEENSCTPFVVNSSWKTLCNKILDERPWKADRPDESKTVILPFRNGYLHITADKAWMEEPNPDYGIKHCANVALGIEPGKEFKPEPIPADSHFGRYLNTSLANLETRAIVQQHCAMSFMRNKFHLVGWWVGDAGVGKSVLVKMLHHIHGSDDQGETNYAAVDLTKLDGEHYLQHIVDKTFISVGEVNVSRPWCEDTSKMVWAGDAVDVNPKSKDIFSYVCEAFWIICSNQSPVVRDESGGVMRRLQVVMWEGSLEQRGSIVYDLDKIVFEQEPHLLVGWVVEGIQNILRQGGPVRDKQMPEAMQKFTQRLRKDNDSVESWVQDCSIVRCRNTQVEIRKQEVYEHYLAYCAETCIDKPRGAAVFWKILARKMSVNIDDITKRPNLADGGKGPALIRGIAIKPKDIAVEMIDRLKDRALLEGRYTLKPANDDPFGTEDPSTRMDRVPNYNAEEEGKLREYLDVIYGKA
jgi:P4 family phage/plasmid primase-like protien